MRDWGGAPGMQHPRLLAETLGLAMARRAADILQRHRHDSTRAALRGTAHLDPDPQFAADDAVFTAVLDAAINCLGHSGAGSAEDRWCDALVHLLLLAREAPDAD